MILKMNFLSKFLSMQTNVTVFLPSFSYEDEEKGIRAYQPGVKYQALTLLHGGGGDDSDYLHFSNVVRYANEHKLAVVMPCGFNSDYTDNPLGARYLRYITDELPAMLHAVFPISDRREDNFIGGLSMGAHGAMKIALLKPEQYCAALVMSGAARTPESMEALAEEAAQVTEDPNEASVRAMINIYELRDTYGDLAKFRDSKHDAYAAARKNVESNKPLPEFFFACGADDFALAPCRQGYDALTDMGYRTHFWEAAGYSHEWDFWDVVLRKAMKEWLPLRHDAIYPEHCD